MSYVKKNFRRYCLELVGCVCVAAGVYNFAMAADFPLTGFTGISVVLYRLLGLPVGLGIILLNIPVAIWSYHLLGKKFFASSVRCMLISSMMIDYVAPLFPVYTGDRLLAALCMGVLAGFGYGLIYMQNSSTGGLDFVVMGIKSLRPHLSVGRITLVCDTLIVIVSGLLYSDIDGIIYGLVASVILSTVVDKLMYGSNAGKLALIVTDNGRKISRIIDETCDRGSTIIKAMGAYGGGDKDVVMCALSKKEMYPLTEQIRKEDPTSFTIILESNEVHGEGFNLLEVGKRQEKIKSE